MSCDLVSAPTFCACGLAVLEQDERRNAADAVLGRRGGLASMSSLATVSLPVVLLGDLVQHRREHLARAAPLGPEIDQHRACRDCRTSWSNVASETCLMCSLMGHPLVMRAVAPARSAVPRARRHALTVAEAARARKPALRR